MFFFAWLRYNVRMSVVESTKSLPNHFMYFRGSGKQKRVNLMRAPHNWWGRIDWLVAWRRLTWTTNRMFGVWTHLRLLVGWLDIAASWSYISTQLGPSHRWKAWCTYHVRHISRISQKPLLKGFSGMTIGPITGMRRWTGSYSCIRERKLRMIHFSSRCSFCSMSIDFRNYPFW